MSKFIKVTDLDSGEILLNTEKIVSVRELNTRTRIDILDDYVHVAESLEQIEAQLLRDEFAMAALNATIIGLNSIVGNHEHHGWSDQELVSESYRVADAMLKERVK